MSDVAIRHAVDIAQCSGPESLHGSCCCRQRGPQANGRPHAPIASSTASAARWVRPLVDMKAFDSLIPSFTNQTPQISFVSSPYSRLSSRLTTFECGSLPRPRHSAQMPSFPWPMHCSAGSCVCPWPRVILRIACSRTGFTPSASAPSDPTHVLVNSGQNGSGV